jgi:hypothetical protein
MGDHLCIGHDLLAVWTGGTDLDPVDDPDSHADRIRFHSKKDNLGFHATPHTGTVDVTNWSDSYTSAPRARKKNLFAHGLSYRPLLLGYLTIGSYKLPIQGSIIHRHSTGMWFGYTIGADDTYVFLNQLRFLRSSPAAVSTTVGYSIWTSVYGAKSDNSVRRPTYFNGLEITDEHVKAGYFDTQYRYPFKDVGGNIPFVRGRSISLGVGYCGTGASSPDIIDVSGLGFRYSVDGYVAKRNATPVSTTITGNLPGNDASFNADVVNLGLSD